MAEIDAIQIMTTFDRREAADDLAHALIEARLAACIQILGPMTSVYRWEGAVEEAQEWLCLIKTRRAYYAAVEEAVRRRHPYQTPEILALPVVAGSADYLAWLAASLDPTFREEA